MSDRPDLSLDVDDVAADPMVQFRRWYEDAEAEGIHLVNSIALATADASGAPSVRHVLLRGFDERGFSFYTNYESRKGRELSENPRGAFTLLWKELDRQISVKGSVHRTSVEESEAYFATRPREARIGAWASRQSTVIETRDELMRAFTDADERYSGDDIPLPPYWGGFRLVPDSVEFWHGRAFRLHDRLRYSRDTEDANGWRLERLSP
ncbi:MAG: pyridoxamine 5'-phosphate oxidase [Actinomycetota bacterium]|nr:pyridoxamine 5'-phosphate oxidase [Actinomycetota bacterium]